MKQHLDWLVFHAFLLAIVVGVAVSVVSVLNFTFGPCPDEPPRWFAGMPSGVLSALRR